jgi:hypothetical protein
VRDVLVALSADDVDRGMPPWLEQFLDQPLGGLSADGKVLRGGKRDDAPALQMVSLVTQECASVLTQREAIASDEMAALLILLTEVPLASRTVTLDAALLLAQATRDHPVAAGRLRRVVKGNQREVLSVLDDWVAARPYGAGASRVIPNAWALRVWLQPC